MQVQGTVSLPWRLVGLMPSVRRVLGRPQGVYPRLYLRSQPYLLSVLREVTCRRLRYRRRQCRLYRLMRVHVRKPTQANPSQPMPTHALPPSRVVHLRLPTQFQSDLPAELSALAVRRLRWRRRQRRLYRLSRRRARLPS